MDESIQVSCIIDKLPPSWRDFKHTLKHLKEELTLVELGGHMRIEESLRVQDSDKPKSNNVAGLTESRVLGAVVRLPDPKLKMLGERGIECIFVGYAKHSKAFRFYVIEPYDSTKSPNGTEDIGDLVALEEVTEEVVQQPKPELRKVAHISTIRLLIAMASIHNLIIHQMDVKTTFLNGDLDEEVYMNQPQGFNMPGNENKVYKLIKSLYGLKQAPNQWHQKFDEVVLSNGYLLNQADKCVYSKFDETGKGVISPMICERG
ncbi:zinc finger, CCHC-type containing protein [Tanacetum coccineum]